MIFIFLVILLCLFGFVLLFGAPYVPTMRKQSQTALDMVSLKPGQTLYELGSGDGRVLRQAAQRGYNVVGYEINPLLALIAYVYTWKYRKQVKVVCGNFWKADLAPADAVFVFLLDRYMEKLDNKMKNEVKKGTLLASFAFQIPDKKIAKQSNGIFLYKY